MTFTKLSDYDSKMLVAENENKNLYIIGFGGYYKFCEYFKESGEITPTLVGVEDHWNLTNKTQFITNAFDVATRHFDFNPDNVLTKYPRNKTIVTTENERVAINTAIRLLKDSNSDHAEQAYFYLKALSKKF